MDGRTTGPSDASASPRRGVRGAARGLCWLLHVGLALLLSVCWLIGPLPVEDASKIPSGDVLTIPLLAVTGGCALRLLRSSSRSRYLLPLGLAALLISGATGLRTSGFLDGAVHTRGHVVGWARHMDLEGAVTYHATVEYAAADGRVLRAELRNNWSHETDYPAGIQLVYDPTNPAAVRLDGLLSLWNSTMAWGLVGLIAVGLGIGGQAKKPSPNLRRRPDTPQSSR